MHQRPFFHRETEGIRITVRPAYLREHSRAAERQFVFAYFVRLENVGEQSAQLLTRRWMIHDDIGEDSQVEGVGVVGEQPILAPGDVHEYQSFCVLKSPSGYMEGAYRFVRGDGASFDAPVPRFTLDAKAAPGPRSCSAVACRRAPRRSRCRPSRRAAEAMRRAPPIPHASRPCRAPPRHPPHQRTPRAPWRVSGARAA